MNSVDHMKHLIQLVESAEQLDEINFKKAAATALAVGSLAGAPQDAKASDDAVAQGIDSNQPVATQVAEPPGQKVDAENIKDVQNATNKLGFGHGVTVVKHITFNNGKTAVVGFVPNHGGLSKAGFVYAPDGLENPSRAFGKRLYKGIEQKDGFILDASSDLRNTSSHNIGMYVQVLLNPSKAVQNLSSKQTPSKVSTYKISDTGQVVKVN